MASMLFVAPTVSAGRRARGRIEARVKAAVPGGDSERHAGVDRVRDGRVHRAAQTAT
jgi:hypothetical protein